MVMHQLPTLSIVTPTLNQGDFIQATIASVLGQAYPALDYLIKDGGSIDQTLSILAGYETRLRWTTGPDRGQSAAINQGWKLSRGDIIAWINSDDIYYPGALLQVGEFFMHHPEIDLLYGDCDYIDEQGTVLGSYPTRPYDYLTLVQDTHNYLPQPAVFMRRPLLDQIGCLDESLHYVMDFDYWLRAGLQHRIGYLPVRLAALRIHQSAKSIAWLGKFSGELVLIYEKLFSRNDLPASVKAIESTAMSNIHHRAADCAFWAGQLSQARRYALRSWRYAPFRIRRLWAYLVLGQAGYRRAAARHGNPYLVKNAPDRL